MDDTTPTPVVNTFLVCRELFHDARTGQYILVGPTSDLCPATFPWVFTVEGGAVEVLVGTRAMSLAGMSSARRGRSSAA